MLLSPSPSRSRSRSPPRSPSPSPSPRAQTQTQTKVQTSTLSSSAPPPSHSPPQPPPPPLHDETEQTRTRTQTPIRTPSPPHTSQSHGSRTERRRICANSSEIGSLHNIIASNPSKRLYIHPVAWQEEHLKHFNCHLQVPSPCQLTKRELREQDVANHGQDWNDDVRGLVELLHYRKSPSHRDAYLRPVFTSLSAAATSSRPSRSALVFRYNRRPVAKLGCPPLTYYNPSTMQAWAYLDKTWCHEQRSAFYGSGKDWWVRTEKASAAIREAPIDPYLTALFIALAQHLRSMRPPDTLETSQRICLFLPVHTSKPIISKSPSLKGRKPNTLVTSWKQYTTTINDQYLRKFDNPRYAFDESMTIHQTSFPIDTPTAMFHAIQAASGILPPQNTLPTTRKRRLSSGEDGRGKVLKMGTTGADGGREDRTVKESGQVTEVLHNDVQESPRLGGSTTADLPVLLDR